MVRSDNYGWAIVAPKWASPPEYIDVGCVGWNRQEVQARKGAIYRHEGETLSKGWQRAYRDGWRAIRVAVIPLEETP